MINDEQKLRDILVRMYERRSGEIRISPAWIATEAMSELDPDKTAPTLVYRAAHLQLRQMARSICRKKFEDDGEAEQHEIWPDLQTRYPAAHSTDAEPEYVLLEHLSEADKTYNVNRLRREGRAKLDRADALEAWWQSKAA